MYTKYPVRFRNIVKVAVIMEEEELRWSITHRDGLRRVSSQDTPS
jgi:hypothetical protein